MSKNYDLYPESERKIDNWRRRILGYEKMKRDLQRQIQILKNKNKKQKEIIDKINNYIDNYDIFKVFSFPLMKRWEEEQVKSSIDYEFKSSLIKDLKDILKEGKNE